VRLQILRRESMLRTERDRDRYASRIPETELSHFTREEVKRITSIVDRGYYRRAEQFMKRMIDRAEFAEDFRLMRILIGIHLDMKVEAADREEKKGNAEEANRLLLGALTDATYYGMPRSTIKELSEKAGMEMDPLFGLPALR
jgi:hypothetical protein